MNKIYDVYKVTNTLNNKVYIGITSMGAEARFKLHCSKAESGSQYLFHTAIKEFGKENFKVDVIEKCIDIDTLREKEKFYIKIFNANDLNFGYNTTIGGEYMEITEAMREAMSAGQRGCKKPRLHKSVLMYSHEGDFIKRFDSMAEAAEETGITRNSILRVLKKTSVRGSKKNPYIWLYESDYEAIPLHIDPKSIYKDLEYKTKPSEAFQKAKDLYKTVDGDLLSLSKPVLQYDTDNNFIAEYPSIREAHRQTGVTPEAIRLHLRGVYDYSNPKVLKRMRYIWKLKN